MKNQTSILLVEDSDIHHLPGLSNPLVVTWDRHNRALHQTVSYADLSLTLRGVPGESFVVHDVKKYKADTDIQACSFFPLQVADFQKRIKSIPSLLELESLKVSGDVHFGKNVTLKVGL